MGRGLGGAGDWRTASQIHERTCDGSIRRQRPSAEPAGFLQAIWRKKVFG